MKLQISKSSRVGRYYEWLMVRYSGRFDSWFDPWRGLTLCSFVQNIFWRSLILFAAIIVVLAGLLITLSIMFYPELNLIMGWSPDRDIQYLSISFWILFLFMVSALRFDKYVDERRKRLRSVVIIHKPKQPSLVWEYLKAKKKRICPLINVVE